MHGSGDISGESTPHFTPRLDFATNSGEEGGGGGGGGGLTGQQVAISVTISSVVLLTLLVVLVVALVKLVQFIRTSMTFKKFMADASQAEFSRDGNPLYHPDHTPIKLPAHILDGDLDIKIPEYSKNHSRDKESTSHSRDEESTSSPTRQSSGSYNIEMCPVPSPDSGTGMRHHENGISEGEMTAMKSCETQENGIRPNSSTCGMENQEQGNGKRQAPSAIDTRTAQ